MQQQCTNFVFVVERKLINQLLTQTIKSSTQTQQHIHCDHVMSENC